MTSNTVLLAVVVLIAYPLSLVVLLWWKTRDINVATHPYIDLVVNNMPRAIPLRTQVAMELQSHFAERVDGGQSVDEVVRQLGDPVSLAESYLGAVPLRAASFGRRAAAKLLDFAFGVSVMSPAVGLTMWFALSGSADADTIVPYLAGVIGVSLLLSSTGLIVYTFIVEYRVGQTVGKRLVGLSVVQESGTRISLGQSFVRQLPMFLQMYWIDVLFALFTEKSQRAFELVSKTRVVLASHEGD